MITRRLDGALTFQLLILLSLIGTQATTAAPVIEFCSPTECVVIIDGKSYIVERDAIVPDAILTQQIDSIQQQELIAQSMVSQGQSLVTVPGSGTSGDLIQYLKTSVDELAALRSPVEFPAFTSLFVWGGQEGAKGATSDDAGALVGSLYGFDVTADYVTNGMASTYLSADMDPTPGRRQLERAALPLAKLDRALRALRDALDHASSVANESSPTKSELVAAATALVSALTRVFIGDHGRESLLEAAVNDRTAYDTAVIDYILGTRLLLSGESDFQYNAGHYYDIGATMSQSFALGRGSHASGIDLSARMSSAEFVHTGGLETLTTVDTLGASWQDNISHIGRDGFVKQSRDLDAWRLMAGYQYTLRNPILNSDQHEVYLEYKFVPGVITTLFAGTGRHQANFVGFSVGFDLAVFGNSNHGHG